MQLGSVHDELMACLPHDARQVVLFLDIDGTLAEFCDDPQAVQIPYTTIQALQLLQATGLQLCAVTGRDVLTARQLLAPVICDVLGTHGLQRDLIVGPQGQELPQTHALNENRELSDRVDWVTLHDELQRIRTGINQEAAKWPDLLIEHKTCSIALHYRTYPHLEKAAWQLAREVAAQYPDWTVRAGAMVAEIAPAAADKGRAINWYLHNYRLKMPVFAGDDVTDESGFAAVQALGGIGIKIGPGQTCAAQRVNTVAQFADVLQHWCTVFEAGD